MGAAKTRLESRMVPDKPLAEVAAIVGADEAPSLPDRPMIWLIDGETRFEQGTASEDTLVMDLTAQIDLDTMGEPEVAHKAARKLAGIVGRELLRDDNAKREHRLGGLPFVQDIWFVRSQKGPPISAGVASHATTYRVRFKASR